MVLLYVVRFITISADLPDYPEDHLDASAGLLLASSQPPPPNTVSLDGRTGGTLNRGSYAPRPRVMSVVMMMMMIMPCGCCFWVVIVVAIVVVDDDGGWGVAMVVVSVVGWLFGPSMA